MRRRTIAVGRVAAGAGRVGDGLRHAAQRRLAMFYFADGQCGRGGTVRRRAHLPRRQSLASVRPLRGQEPGIGTGASCTDAVAVDTRLSRLCRGEGPANRQAGTGSGCGRRTQHPPGRPARHRQDHAGDTAGWLIAGDDGPGSTGGSGRPVAVRALQHRAMEASPLSLAASHRIRGRLAHYGILFLDELAEFDRRGLEVLREPLESGRITIARAARQSDFPARFQLVAAMNPCACGYRGHESGKCHCTEEAVLRYQGRISGPLLDRIDMQIEVHAIAPEALGAQSSGESSATIATRVELAYQRQLARQQKSNQRLTPQEIDRYCKLDRVGAKLLLDAMTHLNWSARAYHRVLKVARTIADLAGTSGIKAAHVAEAVQYRRALRDR